MKNCVTHHYACDCREEKFKALLAALASIHAETTDRKDTTLSQILDRIQETAANSLAQAEDRP